MALQDISGPPLPYPFMDNSGASPAYSQMLLDAGDEKAAMIVCAPKTGLIRKVHFLTGTVTTGATVDVRLETVSATDGSPTGTLFGTTTNVAHVIADANDNTWLTTAALTADASVTINNLLAVVIHNPAVSPGTLNIQRLSGVSKKFPYTSLFTSSWAKSNVGPVLALEYSDGSIVSILGTHAPSALSADSSASATLHRGCEITPTFKCRVMGFYGVIERVTASGTITFKLFDTDGVTVLPGMSIALDTDQFASDNTTAVYIPFGATATLNAGSKYWLAGIGDGTTSLRIYYQTFASTTLLNAIGHGGGKVLWSQATSPTGVGDWAVTNTRVPWMGLLMDQLDDGVSAGGGVNRALLPSGVSALG